MCSLFSFSELLIVLQLVGYTVFLFSKVAVERFLMQEEVVLFFSTPESLHFVAVLAQSSSQRLLLPIGEWWLELVHLNCPVMNYIFTGDHGHYDNDAIDH